MRHRDNINMVTVVHTYGLCCPILNLIVGRRIYLRKAMD